LILTTTTKRYKLNNYIMEAKNNFFTITGVLHSKGELLSFDTKSGSQFHVRRFILEIVSTYKEKTFTETPEFALLGDAADTIDSIAVGSEISVTFSLTGKTIKGKEGKNDWHKTECKAVFVKTLGVPSIDVNADLDQGNPFLDDPSSGVNEELPF